MGANSSKRTDVGSDCENPVGGNHANGHTPNASGPETVPLKTHSMMGDTCENEPEGNRQTQSRLHRWSRWCSANGNKWKLSIIALSVLVVILIITIICLAAKPHQVLAASCPLHTTSPSSDASPCPQHWIGSGFRCYFFSEAEESWNASQTHCSSHGGFLVTMDTPEEKEFVLGSEPPIYFWLGWRREGVEKPWKQADGSLFNNTFPIAGEGLCAYMNERRASSTWCDNSRHWICTKPIRGH